MNEAAATQSKVERFKWRTDSEETAAFVGGMVGWFGGLALAISTNQHGDFLVTAGEIFGTAGAVALTAAGIVAGVRKHIHNRWLSGDERLYTEEVDAAVNEDFKDGFDTLNIWRGRQEKDG